MLAAIYLGDADQLSAKLVLPQLTALVRQFGSLSQGVRQMPTPKGPTFFALNGGMEKLVHTLGDALGDGIRTGVAIRQLVPQGHGKWVAESREGLNIQADAVVLATPAHVSSTILNTSSAGLAKQLSRIDYASCVTYHFIYQREQVEHPLDINGFFVPEAEGQPFIAAMSIGTKYPERVPSDLAVIRVFVGGARQGNWLEKDPDQLADTIHQALKPVLGLRRMPLHVHLAEHPLAMPQLNVGLGSCMEAIGRELQTMPGLFLAGGAMGAVGLPACVKSGEEAARQALATIDQMQIVG